MAWAALEIQAVYFSGNAMKGEFAGSNDFEVLAYMVILPDASE